MMPRLLLAAALLATCTSVPAETAPRLQATPAPADSTPPSPYADPVSAAPMDENWRVEESDPPRAVWSASERAARLTLSCNRQERRLVLERVAGAVPIDQRVLVLDADGVRVEFPAERRSGARGLSTRIALDAPILDRLMIARRMGVSAGEDRLAAPAPGDALRTVLDACRGEEV